jgi:hypothetical protein
MAGKEIVPARGLASFSCPHVECGAIAQQSWFKLFVRSYGGNKPWAPSKSDLEDYRRKKDADPDIIKSIENWVAGKVSFEEQGQWENLKTQLINVDISKCYSCDRIAVWRADELIYPVNHLSIAPNDGMPDDVKADFMEANEIIDKSPRGAAALLRLCVQKLMPHLGEKGDNINDDIASLVKKGLDIRIQRALDVVRVVGNNAVHPGQIDLKDDKTIATKLFGLVNVIVESQITQAKHIEEMFETVVPESVKAQIEKRDAPKQIEDKSSKN